MLIELKQPNINEILSSNIVREHLEELQALYEIKRFNSDFDRIEQVIVVKENLMDVEVIYERFIRLTILEPNLKSRMKPKENHSYNMVNGFVGFNGKSLSEREEFY